MKQRPMRYLIVITLLLSLAVMIAWGQEPSRGERTWGRGSRGERSSSTENAGGGSDTRTAPGGGTTAGTASGTAPATSATPTPGTGPAITSIPLERPADPEKVEVSIAFVKADLSNVLAFLSMASGVPVVVDADVKGTVTITSVQKVTLPVAYEVINSALRVRGYTMVGGLKDTMIRVVPLKKAFADKSIVRVGTELEGLGDGDFMVTQVIPLQNISAARLREELKPLVADDQANLLAVSSTNTLIVTDTEGNVRRMLEIINLLDKDTSDVVDVEVYPCKYASAKVLVTSLETIFATNQNRPGMPPRQQNQPNQPNQPMMRTDDGPLSLKGELRFSADERTNAIIISASRPKIELVLALVKKLDIDTSPEVRAKIFQLKFADASLVATQLSTIFEQPQATRQTFWWQPQQPQTKGPYAGMKENMIVADIRTNSIIVTATETNLAEFEAVIKQLDAPSVLSDVTRSFPLKYAKAPALAQTLTSLFRGSGQRASFRDLFFGGNTASRDGDPITSLRNITVVAEEKSNTLLITGPPQSFSMVEAIISQLDQRTVQVFIEVAIVDVTLDDSTKFGVEWSWRNGADTVNSVSTDFGLADEATGLRYSVISNNLQALLHALTTRSDVRVYSTPRITTADNVPARISIGRDEPFVSSESETSGGNLRRTVDFKNVSIALDVTPHVSEASGLISLEVQQTINEIIGREPELNAPIIANREAKTTVMVHDGQTIVIGGIIKENQERVTNGVPLLSRLPLVGELFKSRQKKAQQSELMVFLTPHILRDEAGVSAITQQQREALSNPVPGVTPAPQDERKVPVQP